MTDSAAASSFCRAEARGRLAGTSVFIKRLIPTGRYNSQYPDAFGFRAAGCHATQTDGCPDLRCVTTGLSFRATWEKTAMIDIHTHWRPAEIADALRARGKEPRILRNPDG